MIQFVHILNSIVCVYVYSYWLLQVLFLDLYLFSYIRYFIMFVYQCMDRCISYILTFFFFI